MMKNKGLSIAVHLFTAAGIILGFWALVMIIQDEPGHAIRLLALAAAIDIVDGTFARKADVATNTPNIDGGLIDNMVDYVNWVFIPMFWAWSFLDIPFLVCSVVLLASLFGFSHIEAKTKDYYFRGFPSYWNVLVFYFYLFGFGSITSSVILILFSALVFAPIKFIYPSRTPRLQKTTIWVAIPFSLIILVMLFYLDETPLWLTVLSLYYPLYYVVLSILLTKDTS